MGQYFDSDAELCPSAMKDETAPHYPCVNLGVVDSSRTGDSCDRALVCVTLNPKEMQNNYQGVILTSRTECKSPLSLGAAG
jgi:hypothetical protein